VSATPSRQGGIALEARALACSRGLATLFRDLSFSVTAGEWVALRGPNGSGKTTLLRCVAGLTRADAGEVLWDGADIRRYEASYRADLLYAGHLAGINDDLNAEENLRSSLALRDIDAASDAVRTALAEAGLDRHRLLPARRLSAGQRRRIGLARLALDPAPFWALDEPLTALDDAGARHFERLLERHLERGGLALIAAHGALAPPSAREIRMGA
jgi:heme exporter protein A